MSGHAISYDTPLTRKRRENISHLYFTDIIFLLYSGRGEIFDFTWGRKIQTGQLSKIPSILQSRWTYGHNEVRLYLSIQ